MSVISRLASSQGIRDEIPNQVLAKEIALAKDTAAIKELAENLFNKDANIASDCVKTLYETGYLDPALIAPYHAEFLRLLSSKHNRLVWGAMIALAVIAPFAPAALFEARERIQATMQQGSVITVDNGVKVLAQVAAAKPEYAAELLPFLIEHLRTCRSKEIPQHAESTLVCITGANKGPFAAVLRERLPELISSQATRVKRILKRIEAL